MGRKKIAVITPFLAQGGLEKVAVTGAQELQKDYDVTLIVFDTFRVDYPYQGKMIDLKVPFYGRSILKRLWSMLKITVELRRLKKTEAFDLLIVHGELANIPTVLSGKGKHIVVFHENRFAALKDIQSRLFEMISRWVYNAKNTYKIITVSEGIRNSFLEKVDFPKEKITTIYNPYEIDVIVEKSKKDLTRYKQLFEQDIIITVGRLSVAKGYSYLLQVFQLFHKRKPLVKLVILGEGELQNVLMNEAKLLGLKVYSVFDDDVYDPYEYDVYFLGFQSNPFQYISQAKLFVMSSLWEGFGNTLVESMACGTPILSTDCHSGPKEIISPDREEKITQFTYGQYGVLAPVFSHSDSVLLQKQNEMWAEGLEALLEDEDKIFEYQRKGKQRAKAFDVTYIMEEWRRVINECLETSC